MRSFDSVEPIHDEPYPSGPWVGFYCYPGSSVRHRMELQLEFRDGQIIGSGIDGIGEFWVRGRYDLDPSRPYWTKSYPGSHDVLYAGHGERGCVWGTWSIPPVYHGGFRIWPKGLGSGEGTALAASADVPATSRRSGR